MTQTLPRTHQAPPPVLPVTVYVQHRGDTYVLHATPTCHRGTFAANTAAIRRGDMRWCVRCWSGGRCGICRAPSGEWGECAQCCAQSIRDEAAYERAMDHGGAS